MLALRGLVCYRVAQSELRIILRFRVVGDKVHSARAKCRESLESEMGRGGGVVAEPSKTKSVDSSKNYLFVRRKPRVSRVQWGMGGSRTE